MTEVGLTWWSHTFEFPSKHEPEWKNKIERWYQLDLGAYGLVEAVTRWNINFEKEDLFIAASPGASNTIDYDFVNTGAMSASKFVHTAPNIRMSPLCEALNWTGKVLCLQRDPETLSAALLEGALMLSPKQSTVWIFSVFPSCPYTAHGLKLSLNVNTPLKLKIKPGSAKKLAADRDLTEWFVGNGERFQLTENATLIRGRIGADDW